MRTMWEVEFCYRRRTPLSDQTEQRVWSRRRYTGKVRAVGRARAWVDEARIPGERTAEYLSGRTALVFERRLVHTEGAVPRPSPEGATT